MILVTTEGLGPGHPVESLGLVRGSAVRARSLPRDVMAFLRGLVGGEIPEYTAMLAQTREQALDRMIVEAERLGADAIVGVRFVTAEIKGNAAELLVYGTAVRLSERAPAGQGS
jgi:uncharacterized protein YbjQ (UPF0145 family)